MGASEWVLLGLVVAVDLLRAANWWLERVERRRQLGALRAAYKGLQGRSDG